MPYREQQNQLAPRRFYKPRIAAHLLVSISLLSIFLTEGYSWWIWLGWFIYGFCWPHLAYWHSSRHPKPAKAEIRNLYTTACWHGFWIAAIGYSLVPSAMMIAILSSETFGGIKVYLRGLVAIAVGLLVGTVIFGFHFNPQTELLTVIATLPAMLIFPLVSGLGNFNLWRRLVEQTEQAIRLSRIDGLTGLMNREYFENRMLMEFQRCKRGGPAATFVLVDIDHFKQVNDKYGHLAGDAMLRRVASVLKNQTRDVDYVGRYGGEEFGICLINTNAEIATMVVERLRKAVEVEVGQNDRGIPCTVSCGLAEYCGTFKNYQDWFQQADQALYRAKANGRNRTEVSQTQTPSPQPVQFSSR